MHKRVFFIADLFLEIYLPVYKGFTVDLKSIIITITSSIIHYGHRDTTCTRVIAAKGVSMAKTSSSGWF